MRSKAKKRPGQRIALAPQIFNDDQYCGDYEDFDEANEAGQLEEFLRIQKLKSNNITFHEADKIAVQVVPQRVGLTFNSI